MTTLLFDVDDPALRDQFFRVHLAQALSAHAAGLPPLRHGGLDEARAALAVEVSRFLEHERSAAGAAYTHPVFGPLNTEEWARAHFKHAYHHLLQFALIE